MHKKKIMCLLLMSIGLMIMTIAVYDVLSIVAEFFNKIFSFNLPDVWFNSFVFRGVLTIFGGLLMFMGGFMYKKTIS